MDCVGVYFKGERIKIVIFCIWNFLLGGFLLDCFIKKGWKGEKRKGVKLGKRK